MELATTDKSDCSMRNKGSLEYSHICARKPQQLLTHTFAYAFLYFKPTTMERNNTIYGIFSTITITTLVIQDVNTIRFGCSCREKIQGL